VCELPPRSPDEGWFRSVPARHLRRRQVTCAKSYSFLVVTRMHDLMVTIGLPFSLVALVATAHALYAERRWLLFG
jgi:hypothetical protein